MAFLAIILLIACAIYLKRLGAENAKQKKSDTYQEICEETRNRLQQLNSRSTPGTNSVVKQASKPEPKPELKPEPKPKGEVVRQGYCGNRHEYEGGKNLQWELYDNNVLRIWGSGNMFSLPEAEADDDFGIRVLYYSSPWEAGIWEDSPIEEVWIEDGVTSIGCYAFGRNDFVWCGLEVFCNHFPNLRAVHIPASVTKIGFDAFAECPKLVIHAPAGSYAEKFAKEHRITFVAD